MHRVFFLKTGFQQSISKEFSFIAGEVTHQNESELIFKEFCCRQWEEWGHWFLSLLPETVFAPFSETQKLRGLTNSNEVPIFPVLSTKDSTTSVSLSPWHP